LAVIDWNTYRRQWIAGVDGAAKLNPDTVNCSVKPDRVNAKSGVFGTMTRKFIGLTVEITFCCDSRTIGAIEPPPAQKAVLVPIAVVSDHIQTFVELDIENAELAHQLRAPSYFRAKVPNDDAGFIDALAEKSRRPLPHGDRLCSHRAERPCNESHTDCPWSRYKHAA
jgi:hypothetical protein